MNLCCHLCFCVGVEAVAVWVKDSFARTERLSQLIHKKEETLGVDRQCHRPIPIHSKKPFPGYSYLHPDRSFRAFQVTKASINVSELHKTPSIQVFVPSVRSGYFMYVDNGMLVPSGQVAPMCRSIFSLPSEMQSRYVNPMADRQHHLNRLSWLTDYAWLLNVYVCPPEVISLFRLHR